MYDLIVIGAGSAGMASARRAAGMYGKRVCLIEKYPVHLGGTCVNLGCVPKKIMYQAANLRDLARHYLCDYGLLTGTTANAAAKSDSFNVNWPFLVDKREKYLERLRGIYTNNLSKDGVQVVYGTASVACSSLPEENSCKSVVVKIFDSGEEVTLKAPHVLIATGGHAIKDNSVTNYDLGTTSDGFFALKEQPKKAAIIGAGYIAVEIAGMLQGLGTSVTLYTRHETVLRSFDPICSGAVQASLAREGVTLRNNSTLESFEPASNGTSISIRAKVNGATMVDDSFDFVMWAIGRRPNSQNLGLQECGIELNPKGGYVKVDEYQNTSVNGIYAVGDVTGHAELTPVAIAAGRKLMDRIFGGKANSKLDYDNIPTVVFSHPPVGTVGLTEPEAREKYPGRSIKIYKSTFNNLFYAMSPPDLKVPTTFKLVCLEDEDDRVLGIHMVGMASDEILQGFGVALKMGAKKSDLDSCVAIHPTAAEELVTMK